MNSKNIKKHLNAKVEDWMNSIESDEIKKEIRKNVIITGGAIVSLLTGEKVKDYDVYFKTRDSLEKICNYYVCQWNKSNPDELASVTVDEENRVKVFIRSSGVAGKSNDLEDDENMESEKPSKNDSKYRPIFLTSNAITLSDKIQIVSRFYGDVDEIHKNFDYVHCTCSWSASDNELILPSKALECIINKELYYMGSKYPLCSIFRSRKYMQRGYTINAGQYVKMAMQLNDLDLNNIDVLEDQLMGVDSGYFAMLIAAVHDQKEKHEDFEIDAQYIIELVDNIF